MDGEKKPNIMEAHDEFLRSYFKDGDTVALFAVSDDGMRITMQNEWHGDKKEAAEKILASAMSLFITEHEGDTFDEPLAFGCLEEAYKRIVADMREEHGLIDEEDEADWENNKPEDAA